MRAIAAGEPSAMRQLYQRHAPLVFTCCQRIVGDRMEAEQLLLDVFLELWQRAAQYDAARSSPRTYLLTLARSRSLDYLRRRKVRPEIKRAADNHDRPAELISSPQLSPAQQSMDTERADLIRAAVNNLDPDQRRAIECAFYEGMTQAQVATRLGVPLGTIKTRLRLGLSKLRDRLRRLNDRGAGASMIQTDQIESGSKAPVTDDMRGA
jgi:RNA polymerase sigma-70 factor (ECF subfamily)